MTPPPDPSSIDWNGIGLWAGGVATVLASIGVAVWSAVTRATKVAEALPAPAATIHNTDVYTTDSVAMHELTRAIEASNVLMTEGNALRRDATDERRSLKQAMDENTAATERSAAQNAEVRDELRDLGKEIVRLQTMFAGRR